MATQNNYLLNTQLCTAALSGKPENVRLLLDRGTAIDAQDFFGTPLYHAVAGCSIETVQLLLEQRAKINTLNRFGYTPLHLASGKGYEKIIQLLLAAGADVHLRNFDGETPLYLFVDHNYRKPAQLVELVSCFWEHGALLFEPLQVAAYDGQIQSTCVYDKFLDDLKPTILARYEPFIQRILEGNDALKQKVDKEEEAHKEKAIGAQPNLRYILVERFLTAKRAVKHRLAPQFAWKFQQWQQEGSQYWAKLPKELCDEILVHFLIGKGINAQFAPLLKNLLWDEVLLLQSKASEAPIEASATCSLALLS